MIQNVQLEEDKILGCRSQGLSDDYQGALAHLFSFLLHDILPHHHFFLLAKILTAKATVNTLFYPVLQWFQYKEMGGGE